MVAPLARRQPLLPLLTLLIARSFATAAAVYETTVAWHADALEGLHRFDGIGAVSGGGATSRLLVEYPQEVRDEIYDFLFLPNHGASLHMAKVEIGGDAESTDGSETSHMHSADDLDLTRGYEWEILREAKRRNPDILTYGLPWAFPGWLGGKGSNNPFVDPFRTANYTVQWVIGARDVHGIEIDYLGIWNERGADKAYTLALRKVLDANGFNKTQIVSNDGNANEICPVLNHDSQYAGAVDIVGLHYPNDRDRFLHESCPLLKKPIWSAEESSSYDDLNGAACWARIIAAHYVHNNITSNLMWNLVGSYFHGTNWYASSLLTAVQPWSGFFESAQMPVLWATAHYTQFTKPGWRYLPIGSGSGELAKGGYYNTFVSPDGEDFTLVIVKISRDHASCTRPRLWDFDTEPETVRFHFSDGPPAELVAGKKLYGRFSNLEESPGAPVLFESFPVDLNADGSLEISVPVGAFFTISTIATSNKAEPKTQASRDSQASFPLPYRDDFATYSCSGCYARYLTDQMGAFEIRNASSSPPFLRQVAPKVPVHWQEFPLGPLTILGMTEWEDVAVATRFRIPRDVSQANPKAAACVVTRTTQVWNAGIALCASRTQWVLRYGGPPRDTVVENPADPNVIASGSLSLDADSWYKLELVVNHDHVERAVVGNQRVAQNKPVRSRDNGFVGLAVNGYHLVEFEHLAIDPVGTRWKLDAAAQELSPFSKGSTLGLRPCTANGVFNPRQAFALESNWQIRLLGNSGQQQQQQQQQCVDASDPAHLKLGPCRAGESAQEFRNDYTNIRNNLQNIWHTAGHLIGNLNGQVWVGPPKNANVLKWTYFPNTFQLRTQLSYKPDIGAPQCLTVIAAAEEPGQHADHLRATASKV